MRTICVPAAIAWTLGLAVCGVAANQTLAEDAPASPFAVSPGPDPFAPIDTLLPSPSESRLPSGAPGPAYWQQKVSYKLDITIDEPNRMLRGREHVRYENKSPHTLTYLWLALESNQAAPFADGMLARTWKDTGEVTIEDFRRMLMAREFDGSAKILSLKDAAGADLNHTLNKGMLRVDLPQPLAAGATFEFDVAWEYLINDTKLVPLRSGYETLDDGNCIFGMAYCYPRLCAYTDYGGWRLKQPIRYGEFTLEFGDFEASVTVPADHVVGATGTLQNADDVLSATMKSRLAESDTAKSPVMIVTKDEAEAARKKPTKETKTWKFAAKNVRDFAFASSRAFVWDAWGVKLGDRTVRCQSLYPSEGMPLWDKYATHAVAHAIETYSGVTGIPYPWPHATAVLGAHPSGGMEYPMISFNSPRPEKDGTYTERTKWGVIRVIIHETGHNWFPMIVNSDERHWMWLDEGFNSFVQGFAERSWKEDPKNPTAVPRLAVEYLTSDAHQPLMTLPDNLQNVPQNAYFKTAVGLTMLRETILGRKLFDGAFKEYCRRWAYKRAEPADFFRTMEDASGMDLDWFWRGWFFSTSTSDVEVVSVTRRTLNDGDPSKKGEREKAKDAKVPQSLTQERDGKTPRRLEKFSDLKDFYDNFDPHAPTDKQTKDFKDFLERLTPEEKKSLQFDKPIYEVKLKNHGQLPMPLILQLEYDDKSTEIRRYPAEIWRLAKGEISTLVVASKPIVAVTVDPYNETADTDFTNNRFPPRIEESGMQITKPPVKIENPLHDALEKERKAKEAKSKPKKEPTEVTP
ncbi:aminopeptidase [Planctomyces sp. SCGC AG-212-M04]|nr:aminopeptidase [Planctomyces sp. SCGC AG-212-M04]